MDRIARQSAEVRDWALGATNSSKECRKGQETFINWNCANRGFSALVGIGAKTRYYKEIARAKRAVLVGMALAA